MKRSAIGIVVLFTLCLIGTAAAQDGKFSYRALRGTSNQPGEVTDWLKLKLCLSPASKLKFVEAGLAIRPFVKREFARGNMDPNQFIERVARQTGYSEEEIRTGQGYACYAYFSFLPAATDFLFSEGFSGMTTKSDLSALNSFVGGIIANESAFVAREAFARAKDAGFDLDDADFAAFRNSVYVPGLLRLVETNAASGLKRASEESPPTPATNE